MRRFNWLLLAVLTVVLVSSFAPADRVKPESYVVEQFPNLLVHRPADYAAPESKVLINAVQAAIDRHVGYGQLDRTEQFHLWLVAKDEPWPEGLAIPPVDQAVRAGGPFVLVAQIGASMELSGVDDAVAIALSQPAGSPAYAVPWLYTGMAAIWQADPETFPIPQYRGPDSQVLQASVMLDRLTADSFPGTGSPKYPAWREASTALSAFLVDRLGIDWPSQFATGQQSLAPEATLTWTTDVAKAEALARWQARMESIPASPEEASRFRTLADISPVRARPELSTLPQGPGPNPNASPHTYVIVARYEPSRREVSGQAELVWQNREGIPIDRLWFNLWANAEQYAKFGGAIDIRQVLVNGQPASFASRGMDLEIPLGQAVQRGSDVRIQIAFTTKLPAAIPSRLLGQQDVQRFNLTHWYPQLAVLDDRGWNLHPLPLYPGEPYQETADYRVTLDLPAGTQLGATGRLEQLEQGAERWIYHYSSPQVRDWAATGGRDLAEKVIQVGHVRVHLIDSDPAWVEAVAPKLDRALPFFEERFGPYPSDDLVVTCCGGLEYPGLFFGAAKSVDGVRWIHTLHHELAHQWFYSLVGNDQFTEPWLDEGFARYADRLAAAEFHLPPVRTNPDYTLPAGLRTSSSSSAYLLQSAAYGQGVYNQAADTLQLLADRIGSAAFDRLMHEWVRRYSFKTATTIDFIRLAEEISGTTLTDFFRERRIDPSDRVPYEPLVSWPLLRTAIRP